jgi:AraC family transcriptional regulator, arabinose operon regulatory protein
MYYVDRPPVTLTGRQPRGPVAGGLSPLEGLLINASCRVLSAGWFPGEDGWRLERRVMPHYIAFVGVGGVAEFAIGGVAYRLTPRSVLLMPPDVPQEGRHVRGTPPMEVYSLHFTARVYGVLDLAAMLGLPAITRLSDDAADGVVAAARRIVAELAAREPGYVLAADGECMRLLAALWRETLARRVARSSGETNEPGQVARLAPVFELIQARYAEGLTLRDMAGVLHLHPAYFCTLFRRITGWSPVRFLARYRLDRARELLASTDRPVQEIAAVTGYGDPSHLRRELRRREGLSPRDYRGAKKSPAVP